jgi:hypothetical protein
MVPSILILLSLLLWPCAGYAQSPFYRGKTLRLVAGTPAGSVYDLYVRMVAKFIGKYLPGNPNIVVQNMTGVASLEDAKKKWLDLDPVSGEELESLGKEIMAQSPDVIERMKKLLGT